MIIGSIFKPISEGEIEISKKLFIVPEIEKEPKSAM